MKNYDIPNYEVMLDMVSGFQWLPDVGDLRIFAGQPTQNPVADSLHRVAEELNRLPPTSTIMDMRVTMGKILLQQNLVRTCGLREIVDATACIEEFIGTTPDLIGHANLHLTAYALRVRVAASEEWNSFCVDVDRLEWRVSGESSGSSSMSISVGGGVAEDAEAKVGREDGQDNASPERPESGAGKTGDTTRPAQDRPRRGLARVFDDEDFNEKAGKLLDRYREEDVAAAHTVVSTPESTPTRCSVFHKVVQDKLAALRSGHKGGKR